MAIPIKIPGVDALQSLAPPIISQPRTALDQFKQRINAAPGIAGRQIANDALQFLTGTRAEQRQKEAGPDTSAITNRVDPKTAFEWEVQLPVIVPSPANNGGSFFINSYVESANLPMPFFEVEGIFREGVKISIPSFRDIGMLTLNFYEDQLMSATQYLETWKQRYQIYGTTNEPSIGGYYMPVGSEDGEEGFKQVIDFVAKSPKASLDGSNSSGIPVMIISYFGVFPTNTTGMEFLSENGRIVISQEFSVSGIAIEIPQDADSGLPVTRQVTSQDFMQGAVGDLLGSLKDQGKRLVETALGPYGSAILNKNTLLGSAAFNGVTSLSNTFNIRFRGAG